MDDKAEQIFTSLIGLANGIKITYGSVVCETSIENVLHFRFKIEIFIKKLKISKIRYPFL